MPWIHVLPDAPELSLMANGIIRWNFAVHTLMGNPTHVNLLINTEPQQLGLGPGNHWPASEFWQSNKLYYRINAKDQLEAAGLTTPFSAEPSVIVEDLNGYPRLTYVIAVSIPES